MRVLAYVGLDVLFPAESFGWGDDIADDGYAAGFELGGEGGWGVGEVGEGEGGDDGTVGGGDDGYFGFEGVEETAPAGEEGGFVVGD